MSSCSKSAKSRRLIVKQAQPVVHTAGCNPGVVLESRTPSTLRGRREPGPVASQLLGVRDDRPPGDPGLKLGSVPGFPGADLGHFHNSATVTKVSHTGLARMWRFTQVGARDFWRSEATSASMTTSATGPSAERSVAGGPEVSQKLIQLLVGVPHRRRQLPRIGDRHRPLQAREVGKAQLAPCPRFLTLLAHRRQNTPAALPATRVPGVPAAPEHPSSVELHSPAMHEHSRARPRASQCTHT